MKKSLLLLGIVAVVIAGCKSSDEDDAGVAKTDPSAATAAGRPADAPVKAQGTSQKMTGFGATSNATGLESRMGSAGH